MKTTKVKVNLRKQKVWIGKTVYWYKVRHDRRIWYRNSTTYAYAGDGIYPIKELVALEHSVNGPPEWDPVERRIKDKDKLKRLEKILFRAIKKEIHRRRQK